LICYCDAAYAGEKIERKSTNGSCHLIGGNLVTWFNKRQGLIALSTVEFEYISIASCCTQLIWIKNQLEDYDIYEENIPIHCDNKVVLSISKNPTLHSRGKHIEIRHKFLRDRVQKGTLELQFVPTNGQLANIFRKPLTKERFILLRDQLGMGLVKDD